MLYRTEPVLATVEAIGNRKKSNDSMKMPKIFLCLKTLVAITLMYRLFVQEYYYEKKG